MGHCAVCILCFGKLYTYLSLKVISKPRGEHYLAHMNGGTSTLLANGSTVTNRIEVNGVASNGRTVKAD